MIIFYILEVVGCTKVRVSCAYHCVVVRGFVMYMAVPCLWGLVVIVSTINMLVVAQAITAVNVLFTAAVIVTNRVVVALVVRAAVSVICLVLALVVLLMVLVVVVMALVVAVIVLFGAAVTVVASSTVVEIVESVISVLRRPLTCFQADLLYATGLLLRQLVATLD